MNLDNLKEKYIPGTRIELSVMAGESQMPSGLKGTVSGVDDMGQVHINWDNGSSLALNVVEDSFKIIEKEERIKVLLIEPYKYPKVIEIGDDLDDMLKKYQEKFKYPERITLIDERIIVKPVKPLSKEMER